MATAIRAADYEGAGLSQVSDHNLNLIIAETCRHSVLSHLVNPNYTIERLGLDKAPRAVYDIITDISVGGFTGGNWNGDVLEPNNPFKSGEITMCQTLAIEKKFSRREAHRLSDRWSTVQGGYEQSIGQALSALVEDYGLRSIISQANRNNVGVKAGKKTHSINLGSVEAPLQVGGAGGIKPSKVLKRMRRALIENVGNCGSVKVVMTPSLYDMLTDEQSVLPNGSQMSDNPLITGITSPMLGMEILASNSMPTYERANNGKRIEYVLMVNPDYVAAPMDLPYLEWQTIKHDIFLVGDFAFDVVALTGNSIVVAAVVVDDE